MRASINALESPFFPRPLWALLRRALMDEGEGVRHRNRQRWLGSTGMHRGRSKTL